MNRLLLFLILCIASTHLAFGQYDTYNLQWGGGEDYFVVNSYNGGFSQGNYIKLQLESHQMKVAQWKITATVKNVTSEYKNVVENSDFPVGKLNIMCNAASGPSLGKIKDMNFWRNLEGKGNEVELVNFESLSQEGYHQLLLDFRLQVHAGYYLRDYKDRTKIRFEIEYKLYTKNNDDDPWSYTGKSLTNKNSHFDVAIPSDQVPVYSITVTPDVLLEFNSITDYMNGVEKTSEKGLKVTAAGTYEVWVKSLKSAFSSATTTRILPLDLVSLQLTGGNGAKQAIDLSQSNQLIIDGNSIDGKVVEYNMIYKAKPIEDRFLYISEEQTYSTNLMFELITK